VSRAERNGSRARGDRPRLQGGPELVAVALAVPGGNPDAARVVERALRLNRVRSGREQVEPIAVPSRRRRVGPGGKRLELIYGHLRVAASSQHRGQQLAERVPVHDPAIGRRQPPLDGRVIDRGRIVALGRVPVLLRVEHLLARQRERPARSEETLADDPVVGLGQDGCQLSLREEAGTDEVRSEQGREVARQRLEHLGPLHLLGRVLHQLARVDLPGRLRPHHVLQHQRGRRALDERREDDVHVLGACGVRLGQRPDVGVLIVEGVRQLVHEHDALDECRHPLRALYQVQRRRLGLVVPGHLLFQERQERGLDVEARRDEAGRRQERAREGAALGGQRPLQVQPQVALGLLDRRPLALDRTLEGPAAQVLDLRHHLVDGSFRGRRRLDLSGGRRGLDDRQRLGDGRQCGDGWREQRHREQQ